jgi:hypothetical protein
MHACRQVTCALVAIAVLARPSLGSSQTISNPVTPSAESDFAWSAAAGVETMSLRDIARTTRPVTASPIKWKGGGPAIRARFAKDNGRRLHQVDVGAAFSGDFEYEGPVLSVPTASADRARQFEARYEYRRYPFRDVLKWMDIGFGVVGLGARTSFAREIAGGFEFDEARTNAGVGGSIAARVRRSSRVGAELVWTNGLQIGRRHESWSSSVENSGGGGGWLTTLAAEGNVRLSASSRVFVRYTTSGEGFLASHRSYALSRERLAMGVTYGR